MNEVLNLPALQARLKGKKSRLVRLVGVFREYAFQQLAEVESALAQGDSVALRQSAHTLKGTVISFEAGRAGALALALEQGELDQAGPQVAELRLEIGRLLQRLEELLAPDGDWPDAEG